MKFILDNNLSWRLVRLIEAKGYEAVHVSSLKQDQSSDISIWKYAATPDAVIITRDTDYLNLSNQFPNGPRVVWLRIPNMRRADVELVLKDQWGFIIDSFSTGARLVEIA